MLYSATGTTQFAVELSPNIPRCHHLRTNGVQCGSPALKGKSLCYFHTRARARVPKELPLLEDANSIQLAIMQTMRGILDKSVDHKSAALLLYALQTAALNSRRVDFQPLAWEVVRDLQGAVPSDEKEARPIRVQRQPVRPFRAKHLRANLPAPHKKISKPRASRPKSQPKPSVSVGESALADSGSELNLKGESA